MSNLNKLTRAVTPKFTEADFERLKIVAECGGKRPGEWCRDRLLEVLNGVPPSPSDHALLAEIVATQDIVVGLVCPHRCNSRAKSRRDFPERLCILPFPSRHRTMDGPEWVQERKGWLFLTSTPETRERLKPLLSLWLDFLILRLTAQTEYGLRPVWIIMDELASLDVLPTLPLALAESRKSGS